jgi:hypothetical protein
MKSGKTPFFVVFLIFGNLYLYLTNILLPKFLRLKPKHPGFPLIILIGGPKAP